MKITSLNNVLPKSLFVENVVGKSQFDAMQETILSNRFAWYFLPDTTYGSGVSTDSSKHGFRHQLIFNNENKSGMSDLFVPLAWIASDCLGKKCLSVYSMHANLMENYNKELEPLPHIDRDTCDKDALANCWTAIFYINDSSGDTLFFNDTANEIIYRHKPMENTMIIFPSGTFHSASLPSTNPFRCVINININVDDY